MGVTSEVTHEGSNARMIWLVHVRVITLSQDVDFSFEHGNFVPLRLVDDLQKCTQLANCSMQPQTRINGIFLP